MVEFAWVEWTVVSFKGAATAHECKVGWFVWMRKDWARVGKFHRFFRCHFEDCFPCLWLSYTGLGILGRSWGSVGIGCVVIVVVG